MTEILQQGVLAQVVRQGRRRADRRLQRSPAPALGGKAAQAGDRPVRERRPVRPERRSTRGSRSTPTTRRRSRSARSSSARARRPALLMIAAEELDMDIEPDEVRSSHDTNVTPEPGRAAAAASGDRRRAASRPRAAAAAAKQALLELASTNLGVPVASLTVEQGRRLRRRQDRHLRRAARRQALQRHDRRAPTHRTPGVAPAKPVAPVQARRHAARRASTSRTRSPGKYTYVHNIRVPGMLHGRVVRPRGQGAYGDGTTSRVALGRRELDQAHPGRAGRPRRATSSASSRRRSTTRSRRRRSSR